MTDYVNGPSSESRSDRFQDLLIGHQVGILRVSNGMTRYAVELMNRREDQFILRIFTQIQALGPVNATNYLTKQPKVERVLRDLVRERAESWEETEKLITKEMIALALWEATWQNNALKKILGTSLPLRQEYSLENPLAERIVERTPLRGKTLKDWMTTLTVNDTSSVAQEIREGLRESRTAQEIADRIKGTPASSFENGLSGRVRTQVDGVIKTASAEITQDVREKVWMKNKRRISGIVWSSVLDGKTSDICIELDGKVAPLFGKEDKLPPGLPRLQPPDKRPPAHFRCRSMVAAIVDDKLPRETTWQEWLSKQPEESQKDILGPRRFELLQSGQLDFKKLFDGPTGRPLKLRELKEREGFE